MYETLTCVASPAVRFHQASVRLHAMLRESHGGTVALGGAAELPQVARPEKFVQPTIVVDPKKVRTTAVEPGPARAPARAPADCGHEGLLWFGGGLEDG